MRVAALLLIAAQAALPAPGELPPEQRAAALAVTTFAFACVNRLGASSSDADFAKGSDELGRKLAQDFAADAQAVRLDGAGGRGCRVAYTGPRAQAVWTALAGVAAASTPTPDGGGCIAGAAAADRISAACTDITPAGPRRGDLVVERSSSTATATVTATLAVRTR